MSDYPDYTQIFQLVGSDIMVPIDIQGAYIMLPVDIQAQWATLEISIVAQTVEYLTIDIAAQSIGYLAVNLAASAITLNINITSITGGVTFNIGTVTGTVKVNLTASAIILDINIKNITAGVTFNIGNISGPFNIFIGTIQTVGLYLQPEWATKINTQKYIRVEAVNKAYGGFEYTNYTVTDGKTLYITAVVAEFFASATADADKHQMGGVVLQNITDAKILLVLGGNGGCAATLPTPIKLTENKVFQIRVNAFGNHNMDLDATALGYEE